MLEFGLPKESVQELAQALDQDSVVPTPGDAGPATKRWLGDIGTKLALGSLNIAEGITAAVIAGEVLHFLGIH